MLFIYKNNGITDATELGRKKIIDLHESVVSVRKQKDRLPRDGLNN